MSLGRGPGQVGSPRKYNLGVLIHQWVGAPGVGMASVRPPARLRASREESMCSLEFVVTSLPARTGIFFAFCYTTLYIAQQHSAARRRKALCEAKYSGGNWCLQACFNIHAKQDTSQAPGNMTSDPWCSICLAAPSQERSSSAVPIKQTERGCMARVLSKALPFGSAPSGSIRARGQALQQHIKLRKAPVGVCQRHAACRELRMQAVLNLHPPNCSEWPDNWAFQMTRHSFKTMTCIHVLVVYMLG